VKSSDKTTQMIMANHIGTICNLWFPICV